MYCQEREYRRTSGSGTEFADFYSNVFCVRCHDPKEVLKVRVTEDTDPARDQKSKQGYWGWWAPTKEYRNPKDVNAPIEGFIFVYAHQMLLNMCFPYGPEIEEKNGKGLRLPVTIELIKVLSKDEEE